MQYYTYAYLREDGTPYYIGKGQGNRAYIRSKKCIKPPKDKSRVIFLKQNLTEEEAFRHEKYMIVVFGRIDLGTGILYNRTAGGEGASGRILSEDHKKKIGLSNSGKLTGLERTEEFKQKISKTLSGRNLTEAHKNKLKIICIGNKNGCGNKGKKRSPEVIEKLSKQKTKPDNEVSSHSLWMREYRKERPKYNDKEWKELSRKKRIEGQTKSYKITFNNGDFIIINGLTKFSKENGYSSGIFNVMNGTYKKHKDIVAVEKLDTTS